MGIGDLNNTRAVPGESPGQTVFMVDQNLSSEGSTTTENVVINWRNVDTGATGTLAGFGDINWVEFQGEDIWGAVVDTGQGTVEWDMDATEDGLFLPALSLDWAGIPTGSTSHPYGGCGGAVVIP